jgi:hypothetical protein
MVFRRMKRVTERDSAGSNLPVVDLRRDPSGRLWLLGAPGFWERTVGGSCMGSPARINLAALNIGIQQTWKKYGL